MSTGGGSQKPICTICFEELKPIAEDLQFIPICGHVFHELCIQQWLEYCPQGKKATCPVCKQGCPRTGLTRLYFQSTGDQTPTQTAGRRCDHDAAALAEEVGRLEGKVAAMEVNFGNQQEHINKLNAEISLWKDLAKKEEAMKEAVKKEKEYTQQYLKIKMEELSRTSEECTKLQDRSLGLAKELAALKLVTDLNLGEEEMVKLASLGNGNNTKNAVDVLKKSLAIRNKSYKELMTQCSLLGRSDARARKKLDKAKEKIHKLNTRLQELEKTLEEKENEVLRNLKSSYKGRAGKPLEVLVQSKPKSFSNNHPDRLDKSYNCPDIQNEYNPFFSYKEPNSVINLDTDPFFSDEDICKLLPDVDEYGMPCSDIQKSPMDVQKTETFMNVGASSTYHHITKGVQSWSADINKMCSEKDVSERVATKVTNIASSTWATETLLIDDISKQTPSIVVKKEAQILEPAACAGDQSVPGKLFGSEGANRSIGKWCRSSSLKMQTPTANNGDLISVGADGRGGRVKVLRNHDQVLDVKAKAPLPKKQKQGGRQSAQFNIEHFFGKAIS